MIIHVEWIFHYVQLIFVHLMLLINVQMDNVSLIPIYVITVRMDVHLIDLRDVGRLVNVYLTYQSVHYHNHIKNAILFLDLVDLLRLIKIINLLHLK